MPFPTGQDFDSDTFFLMRRSKKPPKTKTGTTPDSSSLMSLITEYFAFHLETLDTSKQFKTVNITRCHRKVIQLVESYIYLRKKYYEENIPSIQVSRTFSFNATTYYKTKYIYI